QQDHDGAVVRSRQPRRRGRHVAHPVLQRRHDVGRHRRRQEHVLMSTVVLNGLFVGLVYGLLAVGLVVIYRGSRIINFAYGETGMIGAFVFSELWVDHHAPLLLAIVAGVALSAALGAVTEVALIRPLRGQPPLNAMVGTLAVAALILSYASRRYGLYPRFLPPLVGGKGIHAVGVTVSPNQLVILAVAVVLLVALGALYRYGSFGL